MSDTVYTYDSKYNLIQVDYIDGTFETWDYDPDFSQVIEHVDQLGRQTLYEVDETTGNIEEMRVVVGLDDRTSTEDDDLVTLYEYEDDGLVKTVVELRNDVDGTPQLSFVTQYTYTDVDNSGPHIGRWLDTITYGGDNPAVSGISLVNPSTIEITSRNDFGMPETIEDEVGRETTYVYDDLDRLIKVTSPAPGDGQFQPVVEYVYKLSGLTAEVTRNYVGGFLSDITTQFSFDLAGRINRVTEAYRSSDEAETFYGYDLAGNVIGITNALYQSTQFTYDVLNRPIRVTEEDPDGAGPLTSPVTLLAYDALGRLLAERDPVSNLTRREYDQLGRMTAELRPLGATTSYAYDAAGQLVRMTDPQGRLTGYVYDDAGRMAAMWEPGLTNPTLYEYDTASNLRLITDPLNHTSERIYDERGRLTEATDANEDSTLYTYTDANELETLTDAELNTTTWVYDGAGRVKSETNELEDARTYKYDGFGRLAEYTDRNGRITKYTYDDLDQLSNERWYNGVNLVRTIIYNFDLVGNLQSVSDPSASYQYDYDDLNRLTSVEQTINGLTPVIVFETEYDAAGRRTDSTAEIGGTADYANSYAYDALDRLASVTQTDNGGNAVSDKRVDFTYNRASQFASIDRYSDLAGTQSVAESAFTYDASGRLAGLLHSSSSTTFAGYGFAYDDANRITSFTNTEHSNEDRTYTYDASGQLVAAVTSYNPLAGEFYGYDYNGNRLYAENYGVGPFPSFTIGANNQLLSDGTYTYEYDNEGNLVKRTDIATSNYTTFNWDHRNRLTGVVEMDANGTPTNYLDDIVTRLVGYSYDAHNQWIRRFVDPDGVTGTDPVEQTVLIHNDGQIALQFDKTGAGSVAAGDLSHRYLWAQAIDQLLADEVIGGDTLWAMTDHLGSVRDVVDNNGTLRKHTSYDSFGKITDEEYFDTAGDPISAAHAEAIAQLFGYTGRPLDKATGLQNNLHRWYDASVGRWLGEDPIGFAAGDANLYRYVGNMPTVWVDPSGLIPGEGWTTREGLLARLKELQEERKNADEATEREIKREIKETEEKLRDPEKVAKEHKERGKGARTDPQDQTDSFEEAKRKGRIPGFYEGKKSAGRFKNALKRAGGMLPGPTGAVVGAGLFAGNAEAKGLGPAIGDEIFDSLPIVEWVKGISEIGSGRDWFPAPGEPGFWPTPRPMPNPDWSRKMCCFAAGTHVMTPSGMRSIETLQPGELVLTRDFQRGRMILTRVTALDVHPGEFEMLQIRAAGRSPIEVTKGHYFWCADRWVASENLRDGAQVTDYAGRLRPTSVVREYQYEEPVYNIQTEAGTYLVGERGLLVSGVVAPEHTAAELCEAVGADQR